MANKSNVSTFLISFLIISGPTALAKPIIGDILKFVGNALEPCPFNPGNYFRNGPCPVPSFPFSPSPACPCSSVCPRCPYPPVSPTSVYPCACPTVSTPSFAVNMPSLSLGRPCVSCSPCLCDDSCYGRY